MPSSDSRDRRKRRTRLEELGVLEVDGERTVAAHRVAGDRPAGEVLVSATAELSDHMATYRRALY